MHTERIFAPSKEARVIREFSRDEILSKVTSFIEETFKDRYDIYDICLKPVNKHLTLQIFLDSSEGIKIRDCEIVSRALSQFLDEIDLLPQRYFLEVSSPGAERKLKRIVDFERQIGRLVRWVLRPIDGKSKEVFQARLQEFTPERILVLTKSGPREFPLAVVEEAKTILEFPRKTSTSEV